MTKTFKKASYALFSIIAILCFALAMVPFLKKPAQANAETAVATIATVETASVRLDNYSGIRFSANVNESFYAEKGSGARYGFLLSKASGLTKDNFVASNTTDVVEVRINSWISDSWSDAKKAQNPGIKQYSLVLTGITPADYQTEFSVRAFVVDGTTYTYADQIVTKTLLEVANQASNDNTSSFSPSESEKLEEYLNTCTNGEAHQYDAGVLQDGVGIVKTCSVCNATIVSDPVKVWSTEDKYATLDRNGMEYRQSAILPEVPQTFAATVNLPYKLGKSATIISNMVDYDKRKYASETSSYEVGINSDGIFYITLGAAKEYIFNSTNTTQKTAVNCLDYSGFIHMAITTDVSTGTINLYINGELKGTITGATISTNAFIRPFAFGRNYHSGNTNGFDGNGFIKNVALWSDVRTVDEIKTDASYIFNTDENLLLAYDFTDTVVNDSLKDYSKQNIDLVAHETWFDLDKEELGEFAYSLAIVGDTQSLVNYYPDKAGEVYDWIVAKKDEYKIGFVVNLGDITENKYSYHGNVAYQWRIQQQAISKLDGVLPYQLVRGNHDQTDYFNHAFNNDSYNVNINDSYNGGIEQSYSIVYMGGYKYMFMTVNNNPSAEQLAWANQQIAANPDARVIVSTHGYLQYTGVLSDSGDSNGTAIWENVVKNNPNVMMVLCGHIAWDPILIVEREGTHGNVVTEMLIDPQYMDQNNGASGMVTMFYFTADGSQIKVRYFSTIRNKVYSILNFATIDTSAYKDLGKGVSDTVKPVITANNQPEGILGARYFINDVLVRDDKDGYVTPTYKLYLKSDSSKTAIDITTENGKMSFVPAAAGTYVLEATAVDTAGNTAVESFDIFIRGAELKGNLLEDFATADTLIGYTGRNQVEWLESYQGANGVMHLTSTATITAEGGYKDFMMQLLKDYQDIDLKNNVIKIKAYASETLEVYDGYSDGDGYGELSYLVGGYWSTIEVKNISDLEFFMDGATNSGGARLFKFKPATADLYIDEISVGVATPPVEKVAGEVNFDTPDELANVISLDNKSWLPEYKGANGVVKGTAWRNSEYWYGLQVDFNETSTELQALEWDALEIKFTMGWSAETAVANKWGRTTVDSASNWSYTSDENDIWRTYSISKDAILAQTSADDDKKSFYTAFTDGTLDWTQMFYVSYLAECDGLYIDYMKLVKATESDPSVGVLTFDDASTVSYVKSPSTNKVWLESYKGATGVVQGTVADDWKGIQIELPVTVQQLRGLTWDTIEIRMGAGFDHATSGRTSWDGFYDSGWTMVAEDDGFWVKMVASKATLASQSRFGSSIDGLYKSLTDGTDSPNDSQRLFTLWNLIHHGTIYIDYIKLYDSSKIEVDPSKGVMEFSDSADASKAISLVNPEILAEYKGATGVLHSTDWKKSNSTDAVGEYWYGLQLDFNATPTELKALKWDRLEIKFTMGFKEGAADWSATPVDSGNWTVTKDADDIWRTYSITRENIIAAHGSNDFYAAVTNGTLDWSPLIKISNITLTDGIYIDYMRLIDDPDTDVGGSGSGSGSGSEEVAPGEFDINFDNAEDANLITSVTGKEIVQYDGVTALKATAWALNSSGNPDYWYGVQFDFNATVAQLKAYNWDKLELRFTMGFTTDAPDWSKTTIDEANGWKITDDGNWKIMSITREELILKFGSLDTFYAEVTNGKHTYEGRWFSVSNLALTDGIYFDYVRLVESDTVQVEEKANCLTVDFASDYATSKVSGVTSTEYLDNYMGAKGVIKAVPNGNWSSMQFKLGVKQANLEALNWDLLEIRVAVDFSKTRTYYNNGFTDSAKYGYWKFTDQGNFWRVYSASKADLITAFGSIDAVYTALNNGTSLFNFWNYSDHGNFYFDYVRFTTVANNTPLVLENDFSSDISWVQSGAATKELLASYDGMTGVVKVTSPVTATGFQFNLPFTKEQLEDAGWDRLEFKVRFESGSWQSTNGTTESYANYGKACWAWTQEEDSAWRTYSATREGLIKCYGSIDNMYNVLINADGTDKTKLITLWNFWTLGNLYYDYVKLI